MLVPYVANFSLLTLGTRAPSCVVLLFGCCARHQDMNTRGHSHDTKHHPLVVVHLLAAFNLLLTLLHSMFFCRGCWRDRHVTVVCWLFQPGAHVLLTGRWAIYSRWLVLGMWEVTGGPHSSASEAKERQAV